MFTLRTGVVLLAVLAGFESSSTGQQAVYEDGRESDPGCSRIYQEFAGRPKEVRFGIRINDDGEVFFTSSNGEWLKKVTVPGMAVTADVISMDRYNCGRPAPSASLIKGYVVPPLAVEQLSSGQVEMVPGYWQAKLGRIPAEMRKKELEANLVVLYHNKVAFYSNFLSLPENILDLLPMGLFTDSLIQTERISSDSLPGFPVTYEHTVRLVVPFLKNRADVEAAFIRRAFDSLQLNHALIKIVDIRAYSSVEGPDAVNRRLMNRRARAVAGAIQQLQPEALNVNINTGEDWLEFNQGLAKSTWSRYAGLGQGDMKVKLLDRAVADSLEGILAPERKVVATIYFERKSGYEIVRKDSILPLFQRAIAEKRIGQARSILKEVYERIRDNRLPNDYLNQLEVPASVDFWELQSDRASYSYWLMMFDEQQALKAFSKIRALYSTHGRVNYNICALKLILWHWQPDSTRDTTGLLPMIERLPAEGIDPSLLRRMKVNYYIMLSQDYMARYVYDRKDSALAAVRALYAGMKLTDGDRYALAMFFSFYSQSDWSRELVDARIDQLDVSEDLLFYYINLAFFRPAEYGNDQLRKAMLNASNLDRDRFCKFFHSTDRGGAGMQLLEQPVFREFFCQDCRAK